MLERERKREKESKAVQKSSEPASGAVIGHVLTPATPHMVTRATIYYVFVLYIILDNSLR